MPGMMNEIGAIGQRRYAGVFSEEFLKELQGTKGIETYREMAENDDVCGSILYAIETLIRQSPWRVQAAGNTPKDIEAAEFVESCMEDMQESWTDIISEILSFLTFGWSYHEIVYKRRIGPWEKEPHRRSKYTDGLIGWRTCVVCGMFIDGLTPRASAEVLGCYALPRIFEYVLFPCVNPANSTE